MKFFREGEVDVGAGLVKADVCMSRIRTSRSFDALEALVENNGGEGSPPKKQN